MKFFNLTLATILAFFLASCTTYKNIKSNQSEDFWKADFENFSGVEKLNFKAKPNYLVYLDSELKISEGNLKLLKNGVEIPNLHKINHTKIPLEKDSEIKIFGKNAKGSFNLKYPTLKQKFVNVNFNKNIELLALANFLISYDDFANIPAEQSFNIEGKDIKVRDLYAMNLKIANEFKPFLQSKNLQIIKSYFVKTFYLQFSNFVIDLEDFPNAQFKTGNFPNNFISQNDAEKFVTAFNNFSKEIRFDDFINRYKSYYSEMISEVSENLPKENFISEMEHFYGKKVENYHLYPSLTVPFSSGFGVGIENMIGNVFGAFRKPEEISNFSQLNLGFNDSASLRSLCIHEFGHSFVNPSVDKVDSKIIDSKKFLFEPIKDKMSQQGYNHWKICLYEHFVRANEVVMAKLLNDNEKANEILQDNVKNRSFIYLPQIVDQLEYWYYNEYFDKTYDEKVSEIIDNLKTKTK